MNACISEGQQLAAKPSTYLLLLVQLMLLLPVQRINLRIRELLRDGAVGEGLGGV